MSSGVSMRKTDVKIMNAVQVLRLIRDKEQMTKPEVARQLGLSLPTVSQLVDEWVGLGYLRYSGMGDSTHLGGKKPRLVDFWPGARHILALHLGERLEGALIDLGAGIIWRTEAPLPADMTRAELEAQLCGMARDLRDAADTRGLEVVAISVTMPGLVDPVHGTSRWAARRMMMNGLAVRDLLQPLGLPVWVDNECRGVALAERWFGTGPQKEHLISLYTDNGIGAGFIIDGDLVRGTDYSFGEVGHMTICWDGPVCACGNAGCWELYASSKALLQMMSARLQETTELRRLVEGGEPLTVGLIARAIRYGDTGAKAMAIDQFSVYLGAGLLSLIHMYNPECIILYGQICQLGDDLLEAIRRHVSSRGLSIPVSRVRIQFSELGESGDLLGSAALAWDELLRHPQYLMA